MIEKDVNGKIKYKIIENIEKYVHIENSENGKLISSIIYKI